jgi:two-component system, chemotaxis family, sensor kinase Cph1
MIVAAMSCVGLGFWSMSMSGVLLGATAGGWDVGKMVFVWVSGSLFFVLIAFLAGTLANALRDVIGLLEGGNQELAQRNHQLAELQDEIEFQANVVAHDIRGPVSAAAVAIELTYRSMTEGAKTDDDPLMGMALENLKRVDGMIDRLTEVRELKRVDLKRERIDWAKIVGGLRTEFDMELRRRGVTLNVAEPLPEVEGDSHYMTVLLRNALGNALRYVPEDGSGLIRVAGEGHGDYVEIAVSDNGGGVSVEDPNELFRMFHKGKGDLRAGGMGLGLALARRVVERHEGEIWFAASELGGATLRFRLPRAGTGRGDVTIAESESPPFAS